MDSEVAALRELRKGLLNDLHYLLEARENGVISMYELRARYDSIYREIYEVDRKIRAALTAFPSPRLQWTPSVPASAGRAFPVGPCACGYTDECAIWCGNGHETGQCPHNMSVLGQLRYAREHFAQMKRDYDLYRELYATTGDEDAFEKMLDCVYIE